MAAFEVTGPDGHDGTFTGKGLVPGGNLPCVRLALSLEVSTDLPRAESLEEEEERKAPDHGGADDAEQRDKLDSLSTAELGEAHGCQQGHCHLHVLTGPLSDLQGSTTEPNQVSCRQPYVFTHYPP